jgi:DNA-binding transcriptional regulator YiaG
MIQCALTPDHTQTTMCDRTEKLRALMSEHALSADDVAKILNRSAHTVRVWRCKYEARAIPPDALRLLEMTLAARGVRA